MLRAELPISKSIVNRLQILHALRGELMPLPEDCCDDILTLHRCLEAVIHNTEQQPMTLDIGNSGTAMRFLTAFIASLPTADVTLTGCERMLERPIGELVVALRQLGADIDYVRQQGYPPLHIKGRRLDMSRTVNLRQVPSTQFVSALLLIGARVETDTCSPYIDMTRSVIDMAKHSAEIIERDWSAAAFWYEYVALWGGEVLLQDLRLSSLQGDRRLADIYSEYFGVSTEQQEEGILIKKDAVKTEEKERTRIIDCKDFPDLAPYIAVTAHELRIPIKLVGTESLRVKESDRIAALEDNFERAEHGQPVMLSRNDHRIAMSFIAAGYAVDNTQCISKSYPQLLRQTGHLSFVVPYRHGSLPQTTIESLAADNIVLIDDDGKGKKAALQEGVRQTATPYVWFSDADVKRRYFPHLLPQIIGERQADLYLLPLTMQGGDTLLERLEKTEYEAIQALTMLSAARGKAVMCSGANLIARRDCWLEIADSGELKNDIPSGDDMFLLQAAKRRHLTIATLTDPRLTATVSTEPKLARLLRQRMRWAGKAPHYTDPDIIRCATAVAVINILCILCPPMYIVKYFIERQFIKRDSWTVVLLSLVYPYYMLACFIGGLIRKNKW